MIVGKNGSGKSSLLKCMSGIWKPTDGSVSYQGHSLIPRRKIGYLIDPPSFYESFTAHDMLRYYVSVAGEKWDHDKYSRMLQEWQVPNGIVKTFSRGQRQRLGIICSVWHSPDLWLLDEPFTGLDRTATKMVWDTVLRYVEMGERSVVMVLHDGHGLPDSISQMVEVQHSRISFTGSPAHYFCAILIRTDGQVPLHWQPVLSAHEIDHRLVNGQLYIRHQLDDVAMTGKLLASGLNPLSLVEEADTNGL